MSQTNEDQSLWENYPKIKQFYWGAVEAVTKNFFELKKYLKGDLKMQISLAVSFIAFCSDFVILNQEKYSRIPKNQFKFLDPLVSLQSFGTYTFNGAACFDWTLFEKKRILPEEMSKIVQELYKVFGLDSTTLSYMPPITITNSYNFSPVSPGHLQTSDMINSSGNNSGNPLVQNENLGFKSYKQSNFTPDSNEEVEEFF